jgi:hypothetical protein
MVVAVGKDQALGHDLSVRRLRLIWSAPRHIGWRTVAAAPPFLLVGARGIRHEHRIRLELLEQVGSSPRTRLLVLVRLGHVDRNLDVLHIRQQVAVLPELAVGLLCVEADQWVDPRIVGLAGNDVARAGLIAGSDCRQRSAHDVGLGSEDGKPCGREARVLDSPLVGDAPV